MRVRSLTGTGSRICHKSRIHIKFYGKVHAALPMQDSGTIPFKELSFVKLALYKGLSFEFIIKTNYPVTPRQKRSRCRSNRGIIDSPTPLFTPFCRFRYRSRGQTHSHQYPRTSSTNDPFLKWFSYTFRMMRIAMSTSPF